MYSQSVLCIKGFITSFLFTRIWLLPCVHPTMDLEAVRGQESLFAATKVTLVVLLPLMDFSMCLHVPHTCVCAVAAIKVTLNTVWVLSGAHTCSYRSYLSNNRKTEERAFITNTLPSHRSTWGRAASEQKPSLSVLLGSSKSKADNKYRKYYVVDLITRIGI